LTLVDASGDGDTVACWSVYGDVGLVGVGGFLSAVADKDE
jgi:hypothetical protein